MDPIQDAQTSGQSVKVENYTQEDRVQKRSFKEFRSSQSRGALVQNNRRISTTSTTPSLGTSHFVNSRPFNFNSNSHHHPHTNAYQHQHQHQYQHQHQHQQFTTPTSSPGPFLPEFAPDPLSRKVATPSQALLGPNRPSSSLSWSGSLEVPPLNADVALAPLKTYLEHIQDGSHGQLQQQQAEHERALAREKASGKEQLRQTAAFLSGRNNEMQRELQRVTALLDNLRSENNNVQGENDILRADAERYIIEIRGFIVERELLERRNRELREENAKLLGQQEVKDTRIAWLSQEWSTARALRLMLHGENKRLSQELEEAQENARAQLKREYEGRFAEILANAQKVRLVGQKKSGNAHRELSHETSSGTSSTPDAPTRM